MAKKAEAPKSRMDILTAAKKAHQYEVGAGGNIMDPLMSSVRGIRLPSLGLMDMLGFSALRDSCTVLVDGEPGSSKSSLAIDFFNWGLPYMAGGGIIDCENKGAFDIAAGMMNKVTLWLPGHLLMKTCMTVEAAQSTITSVVDQAKKVNEELSRNEQIPFIIVTDPLAGVASEETHEHIGKEGHSDRGHGGRQEALLWSIWLKVHEGTIVNAPVISVFVNHTKEGHKMIGPKAVSKEYNPGGVAQNYATTIQIKCTCIKRQVSEALDGISYEDIILKCKKNSRGPTGRSTKVRKCSKRNENGTTTFWWDWGQNTGEFLAELPRGHPALEVIKVDQKAEHRYSCAAVKMKEEPLSMIGDAVMANEELVQELIKACRIFQLREFKRISGDDYAKLSEMAQAAENEYRENLAKQLAEEKESNK